MDQRQRTKHFGLYIILCALILRLGTDGIFLKAAQWLLEREPVPNHIYSETGQSVRFSASSFHVRESPAPWLPEGEKPAFSREDGALLTIYDTSSHHPEPEALLEQPLCWDLTDGSPKVLILHTHGSESYTPGKEPYQAVSAYRTLDERYNMLSIGDAVAEILVKKGIGVLHDRQIYDHPSYNGSYTRAREAVLAHLTENPTIELVLDLHRDASGSTGKQLRTEAVVNGAQSAQLMLVQGTNFESWQENLSLAAKLHVLLERSYPGIMRPMNLRAQRFNQDLSAGALLVEVGAAGNTRQEALLAAEALGEAVAALAKGCVVTAQTDAALIS